MRRDFYKVSRPCVYDNSYPHDREVSKCPASNNQNASKCPSSFAPHSVRRWSIEHQIERDVAKELLTDRVDVSVPVLNKHYDKRAEKRKRDHRLSVHEKVFPCNGDPDATITPEEVDAVVNDDGMIDPKAVLQHAQATQGDEDNDNENGEENTGQLRLDEVGNEISGVVNPAFVPILGFLVAARWLPHRVRSELHTMSPETDQCITVSREKLAKASAAYTLFVSLIALNFGLLGLVPPS